MSLPGRAAGALGGDMLNLAARHFDLRRAFGDGFEIDVERSALVERAKRADAVADVGEENVEFGLRASFEFGGSEKCDASAARRLGCDQGELHDPILDNLFLTKRFRDRRERKFDIEKMYSALSRTNAQHKGTRQITQAAGARGSLGGEEARIELGIKFPKLTSQFAADDVRVEIGSMAGKANYADSEVGRQASS